MSCLQTLYNPKSLARIHKMSVLRGNFYGMHRKCQVETMKCNFNVQNNVHNVQFELQLPRNSPIKYAISPTKFMAVIYRVICVCEHERERKRGSSGVCVCVWRSAGLKRSKILFYFAQLIRFFFSFGIQILRLTIDIERIAIFRFATNIAHIFKKK